MYCHLKEKWHIELHYRNDLRLNEKNDIHYLIADLNPLLFRTLRIDCALKSMKASKLVKVKATTSTGAYQPTIFIMEQLWTQYENKQAA